MGINAKRYDRTMRIIIGRAGPPGIPAMDEKRADCDMRYEKSEDMAAKTPTGEAIADNAMLRILKTNMPASAAGMMIRYQ